jgi:hypothetical protein
MKLRFIFDLSGIVQEEFFTTEDTELHGEKNVIFIPKLCVTPCSPWLILNYWAPPEKRLS